jgi:hypothetical protein
VKRLEFVILLSAAILHQGYGAQLKANSCAESDVARAIAGARDGDEVLVPSGTDKWTGSLAIDHAITLRGAGEDQTVILDDLGEDKGLIVFQTKNQKGIYRLTGFGFRDATEGKRVTARGKRASFGKGCVIVEGDSKTFRIDHCKFDQIHNRTIVTRNAACGVIDHCTFLDGGIAIFHDEWGGKPWGDGSWAVPIDWGGPDAVYVEDNRFEGNAQQLRGIVDEYAGARFVFRYNNVTNGTIASHGTGSTGRNRGVRQWEIYKNTITFKPPTARNGIHMRGGTGVVFDNSFIGTSKAVTLHTYRFHTSFPKWCGSDGTCGWDLNDPKIYYTGHAGAGSGLGPGGAGGKLVVPGADWTNNQWVGYSVRDLDGRSNAQPKESKGNGPGPFFSCILSNTSDTIILEAGSQQPNKIFAPDDRFEIRKVIQGLDMIGASTGEALSGNAQVPRWLHQRLEPVYLWNNTVDGTVEKEIAIAPDSPIREGVHFIYQEKPNYHPFEYPHPLAKHH